MLGDSSWPDCDNQRRDRPELEPLAGAGQPVLYSYQAVYSGDNNYTGSPGPCETFSVVKALSKTATTVFDAGTSMAWSGSEQTGASAYDTAAVSGVAGFTPTGTVVYNFFINGLCSGTPTAQTVMISGGNVPTSS